MRLALLLKARGTAIELVAAGSPPEIKALYKRTKPELGEELQYWNSSRGRCVRKRGNAFGTVVVELDAKPEVVEVPVIEPAQPTQQDDAEALLAQPVSEEPAVKQRFETKPKRRYLRN